MAKKTKKSKFIEDTIIVPEEEEQTLVVDEVEKVTIEEEEEKPVVVEEPIQQASPKVSRQSSKFYDTPVDPRNDSGVNFGLTGIIQ